MHQAGPSGILPSMPKEPRPRVCPPLYWDEFPAGGLTPEKLLMWAVLQRAMLDHANPEIAGPEAARSARSFFQDLEQDRTWPYSFRAIASVLDPQGDAEAFMARVRRALEAGGRLPRTVKPR